MFISHSFTHSCAQPVLQEPKVFDILQISSFFFDGVSFICIKSSNIEKNCIKDHQKTIKIFSQARINNTK